PLLADFVAEVAVGMARSPVGLGREVYLAACSVGAPAWSRSLRSALQVRPGAYPVHKATAGGGCLASLASLRRFWAIAASVNSSWAPSRPRNRRRARLRIPFK